jgi:type IV pilus assembly protein PilQ
MVRRRQGRRAPHARKPAILLGVVMGVWLSAPAFAETAQVRAIRVSEAGGDTAVVISASARPTFTTWKLEQPARVVVDLSGVRLGNVEVPMDAGTYAVGLVSANVSEDEGGGSRTRIVLTLRQASDYRVEARGNDIVVRVIPHLRPAASKVAAPDPGEAEAKAQAQAKAEHAQAQAKAEQAQAQAKAEQAEAQAKAERAKAERAEAQAKADKAEAQAKADRAEAQAKADKAEAQAKADRAEAQAKADKAEAQAKADKAEAQAKADKAEAQAKAEKAEARAKTEAQAKAEAQLKAEAQSQAAAQANAENAKLKLQLQQARRDAQNAQAMASAASAEAERQKAAVARADEHARRAEHEADQAIRRAKLAERETLTAQQRETERDRALQKAAREVEMRTAALEAKAKHQDEQRQRLLEAERLVAEQKAKLRVAATELAEREQASRAAQAKRQRLEHTGASSPDKALAAAAVAKAEEERKNAADAAERSRKELTLAVATRRVEEARRQEEMRGRRDEEEKLKQAESARAAEETRLAQARTDRARVENERAKLEQERAQLEAARDALAAEVKRLAQASAPAKLAATAPAPVALPIPTPAKPVAKEEKTIVASAPPAPDSAKPVTRPRSITLRVPSRIRRIDFVDEPTRSSIIIDLEEPSAFAVERSANRRVSLRLDHADLPDELVRSLDATEYLGPVRLISSYQDPHARGTVRVDVDLAEDVPNRVRQDGNRIYWDFQKATPANGQKLPALGGPLPPSVLFVPARRVAGYSVTFPTAGEGARSAGRAGWAVRPEVPVGGKNARAARGVGRVAGRPDVRAGGAGGFPTRLAQAQPQTQAQSPARKAGEDDSPTGKRANLTGKKRYTGRRIDLDFKGADIHNILRLLADVGQMNIVTSDEVKGEVTIKMRDVPWDQALDVVLRAKGLGSVREGNLVRVAPLSVLEKELEQEIARQKQIAEVLPTETRLIGVSYAHASSLQDKARDLLSPRGKISVDDRTNNLIVSDVARNLQLIEDLVRNLDTQTSQVVIEARIVEANTDYARQIGIQWGGNTFMDASHGNPTGLVFPYNVGIGGGADDGSSPMSGLVPGARTGVAGGANPNFVVNMPAPAGLATGSAIGLTMGSVAGAFNLNLRLSAMESTGTVRILSSPRITTMDNIDATIEQGVSIPVSVVSAMGAMTQFVDAKLHLGVKPHVTNEGTVMLTVTVTKNEPDFVNTGARGDPTILKKEAKTTMLVRDGDTAVIGGIYTRNSGLSFTKVPFFSDIPVLGWFFRNRKENDNRTEFLVFLTPRIVNRARALGQ